MTSEPTMLYCANHPDVETGLRCNRCEKPICVKCAILTPTGYRCVDCVRSQQKIFNTAVWFDYLLSIPIAIILAFIGSSLTSRIGFFTIFIAPVAGVVIAEAIRFAIRKRRSKRLFQLSAGAAAVGGLVPLAVNLLTLNLGLSLIWQIAFTFIVTSTVYYRLAGIRI